MDNRLAFENIEPAAYRALLGLGSYVESSGLDPKVLDLIKIRASQLNGCAFCLDMHTTEARKAGEAEQRLHALAAWREAPFFSPTERAALAFGEALTQMAQERIADAVYTELAQHFSQEDAGKLLMAVIAINAWNRLAVATGLVAGTQEQHFRQLRQRGILAGEAVK
ncbi:carboxymuconolactone decarboxylase family protein [Gloeobacter violaceus]|nr:carboxymuconolactone decarboxylase family protein [Gloeobacter violaceus]